MHHIEKYRQCFNVYPILDSTQRERYINSYCVQCHKNIATSGYVVFNIDVPEYIYTLFYCLTRFCLLTTNGCNNFCNTCFCSIDCLFDMIVKIPDKYYTFIFCLDLNKGFKTDHLDQAIVSLANTFKSEMESAVTTETPEQINLFSV